MALTDVDPKYPIGGFAAPETITPDDRTGAVATLAELPEQLRNAVDGLDYGQLSTPYREGGWTVRQVVHHVPESHMNSYIRFKLALTEDEPVVKPYDEAAWARLADVLSAPIEVSLGLLENLHRRWVILLEGLGENDWKRTFRHPELGPVSLENNLALYDWHSRHHLAHVTRLRERKGW
jgi:hypothetical protein